MKNLKYTITLIIGLAILAIALVFLIKHKTPADNYQKVSLSSQEQNEYNSKVSELKNKIKSFNNDTIPLDKYLVYLELSQVQSKLGKYSDALDSINMVAKDNEENPKTWEQYGRIYWGMNNFDKAKENMKRSLDIYGGNVGLWKDYITVLHDSGANNDTINSTYAMAVNATNNENIITEYARFLEQDGKKEAAIYYWQKAEQLNPDKKSEYEAEINKLK